MRTLDAAAFSGQDVLVVAPHPDDEVLGCGGWVALLGQARARVAVVVLTDGAGGVDGRADAAAREGESERCCQMLGTAPPGFLRLASAGLRDDPAGAGTLLAEQAGERAFDLLLVPSPLERHPTHQAALVAALMSGVGRPNAAWWGYGVWDAIPAVAGTAEVDVTGVRSVKALAMGCHTSQNRVRSLAAAVAARDLSQASLSRLTGPEDRRAVERLLDLDDLAARCGGGAGEVGRIVAGWLHQWSDQWASALWGPA